MVALDRRPSSCASRWMRNQALASALCSQIRSRTSGWKISAPPPGKLPRPAALNSASRSFVGRPTKDLLAEFKAAGLGSLPGGGAEIFHPDVRDRICEHKADANAWFRIHREAHELGLRSNATMLYGHIEGPEHRI